MVFKLVEDINLSKDIILKINDYLKKPMKIMEVCGTHTMSIYKYGIDKVMPKNIHLVSGPGCPVCVTEINYIDSAIALLDKGVVIVTFADMLKVPGSHSSLLKEKSKELGINFIGNVEGRDAFSGKVDAIVTDGFTGNVFLKTTEGLGKFVKRTLSESLTQNIFAKIGTIPCLPAINRFKKTMDYKSYGGALFLGVKKPVVKAHGSSDEKLFEFTIKQAEKFVENKAVDKMIEHFEQINKA